MFELNLTTTAATHRQLAQNLRVLASRVEKGITVSENSTHQLTVHDTDAQDIVLQRTNLINMLTKGKYLDSELITFVDSAQCEDEKHV